MGRAKPLLSELDPWFEERGYKRLGRKTEWKKVLPGGIELRSECDVILRGEGEPDTMMIQFVCLPQYAKLQKAAIEQSSFRGDPGSSAGLLLDPRILPDYQPLEIDGAGPKWDAFLTEFGPIIEANEAQLREHYEDLLPVADGPYFEIATGVYPELFLLLHAGDFEAARDWIDNLDYEPALNPGKLNVRAGKLTAEEEYQQARKVFHVYIDTQETKTT